MNWLQKLAQQTVQLDISKYVQELTAALYDIADRSQADYERTQNLQINVPQISALLTQINYPNSNKILDYLQNWQNYDENYLWDLSREFRNWYLQNKDTTSESYEIAKFLRNMLGKYSNGTYYSRENAQQDIQRLTQETTQIGQQIVQFVQQGISNIDNWNNSPIVVKMDTPSEDYSMRSIEWTQPSTNATVEFGNEEMSPNFTLFWEEKPIVEDVLEAGDSDFFTDIRTQSDYFNLVNALRNPGRKQQSKVITLYTARPVTDRQRYLETQTVPNGIFASSSYSDARDLIFDLAGTDKRRDIWRMKIDSRYLILTDDLGIIKHYQVASGQAEVPVISMKLVDSDYGS